MYTFILFIREHFNDCKRFATQTDKQIVYYTTVATDRDEYTCLYTYREHMTTVINNNYTQYPSKRYVYVTENGKELLQKNEVEPDDGNERYQAPL